MGFGNNTFHPFLLHKLLKAGREAMSHPPTHAAPGAPLLPIRLIKVDMAYIHQPICPGSRCKNAFCPVMYPNMSETLL